jgi:PAS domain S-box-containing protein
MEPQGPEPQRRSFGDPYLTRAPWSASGGPARCSDGRSTPETVLPMQKKNQVLEASSSASAQKQTLATVGNWEWDFASGAVTWSDGLFRLLGLEPGSVKPTQELFLSRVHPEDRAAGQAAGFAAQSQGQAIDTEFRILLPDGEVRWVANKGEVFVDAAAQSSWAAGALFDITEIREAQLVLAAREERYRALATVNSLCQWRVKPNGEIIESKFGTDADESDSYKWLDAVHPDDRPFVRETWTEALRVGSNTAFSYRLLHNTGAYHWVMCRAVPLKNPDGSVREWVGSTEDIQEIRTAEERLRVNESRLRLALDAGHISTWDYELRTGQIAQSENAADVLGFTCKSVGELRSWVHVDDWDKAIAALRLTEETGAPFDSVFRVSQPDGTLRWVQTRGKLLRSARQDPDRIIGICWDVTAAKRAESAQRETLNLVTDLQSRLDALASIASDFVWSAAPNGSLIAVDGWCNFTGQSAQEATGWGWLHAVHPADREHVRDALQRQLDADSVQEIQYRVRDNTGDYRLVTSRSAPVARRDGSITEWIGVCEALHVSSRATAGKSGGEGRPSLRGTGSKLISGSQVRAARGLLRWSVRDLADASGVSRSSIRRIEEEDGIPEGRDVRGLQAIRSALEEAGVEIQQTCDGKGAVRRRATQDLRAIPGEGG